MDKIAKIRQEIERLYDGEAPKHDQQCDFDDGYFTGIGVISKFLDTLSEEPDKSLEEAANKFAVFYGQGTCDGIAQDCFKAGAEWQKEKMLKEAVEGEAEELYNDGESQCTVGVGTYFKPGEKVYILKAEEEQR